VSRDEQDAVADLFRDHGTAILGYFARRVDPVEDAADLLSDVMLIAWRRRDAIPPVPQDVLWLYGVARNVLSTHRRSDRRRVAATQVLADQVSVAGSQTPEPSAEILDVRSALKALDDSDRELLLLSAWEGLTSGEIAVVVGLPASTVRTKLARARAGVRAQLGIAITA
jgi:RNA polymerase sigma-70 factor (ECF subfamily)